MTIEEAIEIISDIDKAYRTFSNMEYKAMQKSIDTMRKYQLMQADYNARLKADMVAMLTEIQLEIEKVPKYHMTHNGICVYREAEEYISDINKIVQSKIDMLKEGGIKNGDK